MKLPYVKRLISVEEYHKMGEVGILKPEDRVELIQGEIISMSPIGSKHAGYVKRIVKLLYSHLADEVIIGVQDPVRLNDFSEPEPDISLLKIKEGDYIDQHPTPEDIVLLIEVSDSSIEYDRTFKLPNYALADVKECWIIDVEKVQIEVYKYPKHGSYSSLETKYKEDSLLISKYGLEFKASEILK